MDTLKLLPAEREAVLNVNGALRVMGELISRMLARAEPLWRNAVRLVPLKPAWKPLIKSGGRTLLWSHEHLQLHLLKLAHAEDEVPWADLVTEGLPDLRNTEWNLLPCSIANILVLNICTLCRLWAQVDDRGIFLHWAHEGLEHQVEATRCGQTPLAVGADEAELRDNVRFGKLQRGESVCPWEFVEAVATLAGGALNERIAERADVS